METDFIMTAEMTKALNLFLENPFWKEYYEEAPTERIRRFITLEFYISEYDDDEKLAMMKLIEDELTITELELMRKGEFRRKNIE